MSHDSSLGTSEQLKDPDYTPPLASAIPLGIQHVLAMFVSNVTPAIIIAGAAGFGFGSNSPEFPNLIYMIQMSMLFAGVATLFQTIGFGPVGARLPIVQGTSFAFIPIMIPLVAGKGVDAMAVVHVRCHCRRYISCLPGAFCRQNSICVTTPGNRISRHHDRSGTG